MVPLARKTLLYEWRRYLPAALAVAFTGVLLLMQAALVLGIFGGASVYVNQSGGDLWVGYPGTQTIELGRPIPRDAEFALLMDRAVAKVEPFRWIDGDWRGAANRGHLSVYVSGIDARPGGLMFSRVLSPDLRQRLQEPGGVIVDRADLPKLGLAVGDRASINGQRVHIVGAASGLRALGGVNILVSLATAQQLALDNPDPAAVAYYVVALRDPSLAAAVRHRLQPTGQIKRYAVWTRSEFARRAVLFWLLESGAGLGVLFLAIVVFVVGAVITSQTLMGAVAGSIREYAALQALGVSLAALRRIVLAQAAWVGLCGLIVGSLVSELALVLARGQDVPVRIDPLTILACSAMVMSIALLSGVMALRILRNADPALLLR
jgi:putative ABC transport system permease protein